MTFDRNAATRGLALGTLLLLPTLSGCLGGSSEDHFLRLFRPVVPPSTATRAATTTPISIRRIYAASHLTELIEWQKDDIEYGHYDEMRWIESPARIVEREILCELFETRGVQAGIGGDEIEVELLAFEQAHSPSLRAIVTVEVTRSGKHGNSVRRFSASEALADDAPETLARAIGIAARHVIDSACDWIVDPTTPPAR